MEFNYNYRPPISIDKDKEANIIAIAMKKQEIWRQKQINMLYKTGRPIFTYPIDKLRFYSK